MANKKQIPFYLRGLNLPFWLEGVTIEKVQHLWANTVSRRQLKITLSNGTVIRADACHESWEQYGGTTDELRITQDIVERNNAWLHGNGAAVTYDDDGQPTYISEEF